MWLMAGIGAIVGGLFLALREILPWWEAFRTGVIRTRGARPQIVDQEDDPARFQDLLRRRLSAAWPGFLITICGLGWVALNVLGLVLAVAP